MADNVSFQSSTLATPASGTVVATEDIGGAQYQKIAIVLTDGTTINALLDAGQQLSAASLPVVLASDHSDIAITLDGETVTVTGSITGTVDLGATDNAVLDAILAALGGTLTVDGSGVTQPISAASLPLPSGAATAANQSTANTALSAIQTAVEGTLTVDASGAAVPVTDNGGSLTVDGTVTANLGATDNAVLDTIQALLENKVSTDNSTTTPLAGDATYTGTWEDVSGYAAVAINLYSSHDSASSGMQFQFSSNGSDADDVYSFTLTVSNSNDRRFQFPVTARYFRVVYTNGSTLQTAFRVQTVLHRTNILTSIHRVDDIVTSDRSAELVKAVVAAKVAEALAATGAVDGEYETLSMTGWRELRTRDQRQIDLADCNDYTVFTTLGNDTANLADSVNHLFGTGSITFDKVNGAANTVFAGVQDTITSLDVSERFEAGSFVGLGVYLPSVADVVAVFLRVGTDSGNYNEWEWTVADDGLVAGRWLPLRAPTNEPTGYAGNGWNPAAITYVSFGVEFSAESDTLAGIIFDNVHMVGGRVTDSTTNATISSSVNTPNINLHRVGGTPTDANTGNASAGTQRVVLASDQPSVTVDAANDGSLNVRIGDGSNTATIRNLASNDALNVSIVDGSGNQVTSFGGTGGTSATDDSTFTAASGSGTPIMGFATSDAVDAGDVGVLAMDTNRNLKVSIEADNAGIGGGTQYTEDDAAAANPVGNMGMAVRADSLAAVTSADGDNIALRATNNGELYVKQTDAVPVTDNGGSLTVDGTVAISGTVIVDGSGVTQPVSGTVTANLGATDNAVLDNIDTNTDYGQVTGGGVEATALRVTIANDSTGVVSVDDNGGSLTIDGTVTANLSATDNAVLDSIDTAVNGTLTVDGSGVTQPISAASLPLPTGAATAANQSTVIGHVDGIETLLGTIDSDTSTLAAAVSGSEMQVDVVGALPAGTNTIGAVNVKPATSGGLTIFRSIDLDESEEEIKASAGQVYGWYMFNAAASTRYVKFYNATAASVTVGTTTPVLTIPVPAGSGANVEFTNGIAFSTAITAAATTAVADSDTGAPAANDVVVNVFYA